MRQRASKRKCRECGTSSNVSYAPYPGAIPGAATGGRFICGDCLYVEEHPPETLTVSVYGVPQPAGSKVAGRSKAGKLFVRDAAKGSAPWKRQVAQAAGEAMNGRELIDGPITLRATFYVPRPQAHFGANGLRPSAPSHPTKRPDTTKLLRCVEDALTGIVWRDDAQVVEQYACKLFGEPARCELHVEPTEAA